MAETITVPPELREWAYEYRAGYAYGLTDKKGHLATPHFKSGFGARRGFAWRAGRDDAMVARGLIKKARRHYDNKKLKP